MGKRILSELVNTQLQNTRESYNAKQSKEGDLPNGASPGGEERTWQQKVNKLRLIKPTATRAHSQNHTILRDSPGKPQLGEAGTQGQHHLSEEPGQYNTKRTQSHILDHEVTLPPRQAFCPSQYSRSTLSSRCGGRGRWAGLCSPLWAAAPPWTEQSWIPGESSLELGHRT